MTQNFEDRLILSSRKRRIVAILIDHFTMTFLLVAISFMSLGKGFLDEDNASNVLVKILPTMLIGFILYFAKDSIKGISPGKWIMGIMVRDENIHTEIPSVGRLFIRNLLIIIWPIEFFVLAVSQEKKRLGDKIAKTAVLKNPKKLSVLPRVLTLVGIGVAYFTFIFVFVFASMKSSDAYKTAISEIEQNQEIINEVGGIKEYGMFPTGGVSIKSDYGEANLEIKVIGNEKDLNVKTYLTKEPNEEWKLIELDK
ncbi:RDD family protein [Salegentibacter sp. JZCK2]|uniref:RDD family protein n=1 Tax=Salegentibacter tibetensis TaxID=2873600 RepID=UPI001CCC425E|nr:RDD family protein [Salegentibacter tibetensis]MBZ9730550.1 RDD family protein [Salegentibacter tibetensis]